MLQNTTAQRDRRHRRRLCTLTARSPEASVCFQVAFEERAASGRVIGVIVDACAH
jgi:hypothetical protein